MAEHFEEVQVTLTNDKVQFTGVSQANPDRPIAFDYIPPIGDGDGYKGLELLLMSFAGCSATAMAVLLRRMGKNIEALSVSARGLKRSGPPLKFERISLHFTVTSTDVLEADIRTAAGLAEESFCPVWQMIKNNVEVLVEQTIVAAPHE